MIRGQVLGGSRVLPTEEIFAAALRVQDSLPASQSSQPTETSVLIDVSFSCVVKHKDDGQTKFIKPNSLRQDIIIKYWVSIGSIHREQG